MERCPRCNYCEKPFKTKDGLRKHLQKLHRLYRCLECDKDFPKIISLKRHVRSHSTLQLKDMKKTENQLSDVQQIRSFIGLHKDYSANAVCSSVNFLESGSSGSLTQNEPDSDCAVLFCKFNDNPVSSTLHINKYLTNKPDPAQSKNSKLNHVNTVDDTVEADIIHTLNDLFKTFNSLTSNRVNKSTSSVAKPFTAKLDSSSVIKSLNDHQYSTLHNSSSSVNRYSRIKSNKLCPDEKCIITRIRCTMVKNIKTNSTKQKHVSQDVSSSSNDSSWNKSIKKSNNKQKAAKPKCTNVCSISPTMHAKSGNTSSEDKVMNFYHNRSYLPRKGSSPKTMKDSSLKSNKESSPETNKDISPKKNKNAKLLRSKGRFFLGCILGQSSCKMNFTPSVHHDSKGTNLVELSSTEFKNKDSVSTESKNKESVSTDSKNKESVKDREKRNCSKNEKKEMQFTSSSSNIKENKIKNFQLAENKEALWWGGIAPESHAEEINLSEEMNLFEEMKQLLTLKKSEICAHKNETSMDYSPSSSSKYNFSKDAIVQHAISLKHLLCELDFCTETELKLMLKFAMTKDLELALKLNTLKMLPFPKFPHHIPRLYVDFLKRAFKKEFDGGIFKRIEDLISPCPETKSKQAKKIDPIILTKCEREEEMRKAVLTVLDFKDCSATKSVQDDFIHVLDLFLTDFCMNLKQVENEKDPLNDALLAVATDVSSVKKFYASDVIEEHAFIFHDCLGKYKKFYAHRKFIEKHTTNWLKKTGKYDLSSQVSQKKQSTTDYSYSNQNLSTASCLLKPVKFNIPASVLAKCLSNISESVNTTDDNMDERMECETF